MCTLGGKKSHFFSSRKISFHLNIIYGENWEVQIRYKSFSSLLGNLGFILMGEWKYSRNDDLLLIKMTAGDTVCNEWKVESFE